MLLSVCYDFARLSFSRQGLAARVLRIKRRKRVCFNEAFRSAPKGAQTVNKLRRMERVQGRGGT